MLNKCKRNELFKDYKDIKNIVNIQLFQENKIILFTLSKLLIFNVIEKKLILEKECISGEIWLYDNNKFFIELKDEFILYEFIENKNKYSLERFGSINKNLAQYSYKNFILIQGKKRKKIIIFSIRYLNIYNFKKNIFELQIKVKINYDTMECRIKPFILNDTLGYFYMNRKNAKVAFYIFNRKYESKKKDLDEIVIDKLEIKYSDINYKELKNQNKFILSFNYYYLKFYLYSTKDLKLVNQTKIKKGPFCKFYISNNGNIYTIGEHDNCINEFKIEESGVSQIPYYVGWNLGEEKNYNGLISDFKENKIYQLIVFGNKKKLFIFKRREGYSDNYYASFYFSKRSITSLIKYPVIIIFLFFAVFLIWGFAFNKWRISIIDFIIINIITFNIFTFRSNYISFIIGILIAVFVCKSLYVLFKFFLIHSYKKIIALKNNIWDSISF